MKKFKKYVIIALIFILFSIYASFNVSAQDVSEEPERIKIIENTFV